MKRWDQCDSGNPMDPSVLIISLFLFVVGMLFITVISTFDKTSVQSFYITAGIIFLVVALVLCCFTVKQQAAEVLQISLSSVQDFKPYVFGNSIMSNAINCFACASS